MAASSAYAANLPAVPEWLNKGDNAWQLTAATFVGIQSMPGLVVLYGSIVKKKWAVNSAFMALYAYASSLLVWVLVGFRMAFGERLLPFWGKAGVALSQGYLVRRASLSATAHGDTPRTQPFYPEATLVLFQFEFAAITLVLLAGSVLGRMNIKAWMAFTPLWLLFSYTVGAFSLWGGGFLYHWGVIDYSGGYVIHLSSGVAGFTAAYWGRYCGNARVRTASQIHNKVGPRLKSDRERFSPNNILLMIAGGGLLWMGWAGFNGGAPYSANITASMAVLNTNVSAATSLLTWTCLDVIFFKKPSVIGAVQGMMTGLVCITPGAGLVQTWAAVIMGIFAGSIPWFTMMILHKKSALLMKVDDTLAVFHTHAVAGLLGGILTGLLATPELMEIESPVPGLRGTFYGGGIKQLGKQLAGAAFVVAWNVVVTSLILLAISLVVPLRMPDDQLMIGDDAAHGEEAYALWGDGEKFDATRHDTARVGGGMEREGSAEQQLAGMGARGVTIQL
ncbi:ammonium transporter 2 member 1 isoform X1 [Phragmites australis]|uniref:ammonium transporter 2 member 1 isoform X1 n=1 Tax=Phragmites australis TaxID=29695 RepID=UPI002D79CB0A|nr:ammonium transporter 2 member 1 isoform X1 [Phragmites australis]